MPMLRSSYSPSHLDRTTLTESDELVTVEAPTAEEAIDALSAVLGPDIDIVTAGKVARGGVGGFFAREMVQLTARRPGPVRPPGPGVPHPSHVHPPRIRQRGARPAGAPPRPAPGGHGGRGHRSGGLEPRRAGPHRASVLVHPPPPRCRSRGRSRL